MRRSYLRWGQVALVWTVCVLMFLDSASACRFRRRGRDCGGCQPIATCGADSGSGTSSGFGGAGAGVEAPPPPTPVPAVDPVKPAAEPAAEKPAEPAPEKPAAEKPAAKQDDLDDLFNDAPKNPAKPAEKPAAEKPAAEEKPGDEAPAAEQPAEQKPAPKLEDDPFKISAGGQLAIRSWTDDTGSFQIKGRLIAVLDGKVRILKETGKTTTVPLVRLSVADRNYLDADFVLAGKR